MALISMLLGFSSFSTIAQTNANSVTGIILWSDIRQFGVEGRGWDATKDFYDRLPGQSRKCGPTTRFSGT